MNRQEVISKLAKQDKAAGFFLRTPAESSTQFVNYVRWTGQASRLDYGCILDRFLTPPLPGDYITIMARPGHKKTALMVSLAKRYARQIVERNANNEVILYATWDEAVENIEGYLHAGLGGFNSGDVAWGKVNPDRAIEASIQRVSTMSPLWIWGVSIMDNDKNKPPFTADWLFETIQALHYDYKLSVKALFLDYLQIIPVPDERNRTDQVTAASKSAKSLAKEIGCPVFAGVQAGRAVDSRGEKIPEWSDAQHASAIEQDSTKQLALAHPAKIHDLGDKIDIGKYSYEIDDNLTIVRILKQRGERGAGTFGVNIDPVNLEISDARPLYKITTELD